MALKHFSCDNYKKIHLISQPSVHLQIHIHLPSEKAMAPHSSTLAWKIPWTQEPGRLQPMGSLGVGHDWATSLSLFAFMHWRRKWQPTPVFLPGESQGWGAWWSSVYGVAQSQTCLKRLSSSSSSRHIDVCINRNTMFFLWEKVSPRCIKRMFTNCFIVTWSW